MQEDTFIHSFRQHFNIHDQSHFGIGDDCAVIPFNDQESLLITKDMLLEDVHFRINTFSATDIAIKAIESNISDIAAMGGTPHYILLGLAIPPHISDTWLKQFQSSFSLHCQQQQIQLIGGDTVRATDKLCLSITLLGKAPTRYIKYRHNAQIGDIICTTGPLGNAKAGLFLLENQQQGFDELIMAQRRPTARLAEGIWLAQQPGVHAMMDLSDGLYLDLQRLIKASNVGAEFDIENLPLSDFLITFASQFQLEACRYALEGGEDYELLFTIAHAHFEKLQQQYQQVFNIPFFQIGTIITTQQLTINKAEKTYHASKIKPFTHF